MLVTRTNTIHAWSAILVALVLPLGVFAQDKTPDIMGVWSARGLSAQIYAKGDSLMTAWAKAQLEAAKPSFGPKSVLLSQTNDPVYKCFPPGVPRIYFHPFPMQIVQIPGQVILMFEYDHTMRHIFTDGRKHPEDAEPTWLGHSIGHWEGASLVVDTVGFNDKTWLDRVGRAHSDRLHVIEKFTRSAANNLQIEVTLDDPKAYTQPFTVSFNMRLEPKWDIAEMYCIDTLGFEKFELGPGAPNR